MPPELHSSAAAIPWTAFKQSGAPQDIPPELQALSQWLYQRQFHLVYVAAIDGGQRSNWLHCWSQVVQLTRLDIRVMPAVMYSIGPLLLYEFFGTVAQYQQVVQEVMSGQQLCFGLSEAAAGIDLTAIQSRADMTQDGWRLSGEKSPLGWSDRCVAMLALLQTDTAGPTALSFFRLPLQDPQVQQKPVPASGMRGQQFGAVQFHDVQLPATALVGQRGRGLEYSLIIQQFVKFISTAANVGGCQALLQQVTEHCLQPRQNRILAQHAAVRFSLAQGYAEVLMMEATAMVAACLTNATQPQFSLIASVCKQQALEGSRRLQWCLSDLMSVHGVLETGPLFSRYRHLLQDLELVRYMDTNPVANLQNIASQLPAVFHQQQRLTAEQAWSQWQALQQLLRLSAAFGAAEQLKLAITNTGGDWLLNAVFSLANPAFACRAGAMDLAELSQHYASSLMQLWQQWQQLTPTDESNQSCRLELAAQYSALLSQVGLFLLAAVNGPEWFSADIVSAVLAGCRRPAGQPAVGAELLYQQLHQQWLRQLPLSWCQ